MPTARPCKISHSEELSAYADDMLDGRSLRRVARHLEQCAACRESLRQHHALKQAFAGARRSPAIRQPAPQFWSDAYRAARLAPAAGGGNAVVREACRRVAPPGQTPRWRLATLTLIGVAVIGLSLLPTGTMSGMVMQPADAAQTIDVGALVSSHENLSSDEPLADRSRADMILSDMTAQQAFDSPDDMIDAATGAAGDAGRDRRN